jgi:two-component system chemotaxis response regulator CheB
MLAEAGGTLFVERPADYAPHDRYEAARALGVELAKLRQDAIPAWILDQTNAGG